MPYQLSEINEKIRRDAAAFRAECDAKTRNYKK